MDELIDRLTFALKQIYYSKMPLPLEKFMYGEMKVLSYIYHNGNGAAPGEIAEALDMTPARITSILRGLENKKYIYREINKADRRRILVYITEEGSQNIISGTEELQTRLTEIISQMGISKTENLISALLDLSAVMNKGKD